MLELFGTITPLLVALAAVWRETRNTRNENKADHAHVVHRLTGVEGALVEVKAEVKEVRSGVDKTATVAELNHERILTLERGLLADQ